MAAKHLTPDQWHEAEALAVQGVKLEEVARRFGIAVVTLRQRARKEDWATPGRLKWRQRMAEQGVVVAAPQALTKVSKGSGPSAALMPHLKALRAAAGVNPKAFQRALASCAEVLIAEGAPNIAPPRSAGELSKMNELYRKASGLDGGHSGRVPFIRPMRSLPRTPQVVEAEVVVDAVEEFEI